MKNRVICSGEGLCGCCHQEKKKQNGELVLIGEPVVNESMKNCARYMKKPMADVYCSLTREMVHIIK